MPQHLTMFSHNGLFAPLHVPAMSAQ